ncbi:hypothetical protein AO269_07960 [Pseudomonas putida]|nr:hypothetical protein AO269_07960 [Pseudomonas putida]
MSHLFNLDESTSNRLAVDMNEQGYAVLENALAPYVLEELRAYVDDQAARQHLARLHEQGQGHAAPSDQVFPVLRCVQGHSGLKESNAFHFDATLLTMLVPIFIPEQGKDRGDLVLFPNLRKVRGSVLFNAVEKVLYQNPLCRRLMGWCIERGWLKPLLLRMKPGNVYFFWGYRSLHANQPCDPAHRRATALFHYGDPHAGSLTTRMILRLNQHRARRAVARSKSQAS